MLGRSLILFHLHQGRKREAVEAARSSVSLGSSDPRLYHFAGIAELAGGDEKRARELFERVLPALKGHRRYRLDAGIETYLAYLYARAGRRDEADKLLAEALEADRRHLASGNEYWSVPFDMACAHALRGEKDEALRWLEKAIEAGWRDFPREGPTTLLESLRSDPRYQKLMARVDGMVAGMRRKAGLD